MHSLQFPPELLLWLHAFEDERGTERAKDSSTEASTQRCSGPEQATIRPVATVDALVPAPYDYHAHLRL